MCPNTLNETTEFAHACRRLEDSGRLGVERLLAALGDEEARSYDERFELTLKARGTSAAPR
jgi:hypothetical protein